MKCNVNPLGEDCAACTDGSADKCCANPLFPDTCWFKADQPKAQKLADLELKLKDLYGRARAQGDLEVERKVLQDLGYVYGQQNAY